MNYHRDQEAGQNKLLAHSRPLLHFFPLPFDGLFGAADGLRKRLEAFATN
jgi:hypothetical protein